MIVVVIVVIVVIVVVALSLSLWEMGGPAYVCRDKGSGRDVHVCECVRERKREKIKKIVTPKCTLLVRATRE